MRNLQTKSKNRFGTFGLTALILVAALVFGITSFSVRQKADAAEIQADIFSEDFDGKTFSEEWKDPVNAELQTGEYSLRYNGDSRWGSCISPMEHHVTGSAEISFDLQVSGGGWIAFVFGLPRYNSSMEYADIGTWFWPDNRTTVMDDKQGTSGGPVDTTQSNFASYSVSPFGFTKTSMRYVLTKKDDTRESDGATMYKLDLYMYEAGTPCPSAPQASYDNLECDGYYGFTSMGNIKMTVTNFAVEENEQTVFEDDFTESAFMFDNTKVPNAKWAVTYFDSSTLAVGPTADVKIVTGKQDGSITNARGITRDVRVNKQFAFSVEAELSLISPSTVFGMDLGGGKFFAGLEKTGGKYRAVTVSDGEITEATEAVQIDDGNRITVAFDGYSDGSIKITVGEITYTLKGGDFGGAFKLGTKHIGESETTGGYVVFDDARMQGYSYDAVIDAQNRAINFKGMRTYEESGETLYQYYVNRNEWLMQGCTSPLYKAGQTRNYVQFSESDVNMLFGPKQKYSEYICRFTVTVTDDTAKNETAMLFSFGRQTLSGAAWSNPYIVFTKKTRGMEIAGGGGVTGKTVMGDVSFWNNRDAENNLIAYNVMIAVIEGEIEVYFAPVGAPASEMGVLRGTFAYNDTNGYVVVAGHNAASFRISSFSVNNINAQNENAAQSLTKSADAQGLGESVLLSGGATATTKDKFGEFIMYAKVKSIVNGAIDVMLPNGVGITAAEGAVIGKGLKTISTDARADKMLCGEGGILCVRVQNGRLSVGYAANNEPIKLIYQPAAVFELPQESVRGELTFSVGDGSAVLLDTVSVHSLDAEIEIEAQDYDPNIDDDIDKVKPEFGEESHNEEKKGCGCGSVTNAENIFGAVLVAAALLAVTLFRRKKGEEK